MIDAAVEHMYSTDDDNRFLEVTYQNGDKEVLFFKDFSSGAMIENIVRRAKKLSIKRQIGGEGSGISTEDLLESIRQEFREHEDLPEHHQPRRLGEDLGQEGRADRVRAHVAQRGTTRPPAADRSSASPPASTSSVPADAPSAAHRLVTSPGVSKCG